MMPGRRADAGGFELVFGLALVTLLVSLVIIIFAVLAMMMWPPLRGLLRFVGLVAGAVE